MKILESKFVQGFIKMADDGYPQIWLPGTAENGCPVFEVIGD